MLWEPRYTTTGTFTNTIYLYYWYYSLHAAAISCIILDCSAQGSQFNTCVALNNLLLPTSTTDIIPSVCFGATISCIILDCSAQGSQFNTCALNNSPRTLFSWTLVVDEITSLVSDTTSGVFVTMRGTLCFSVTAMLGNQSKWVKKYILITNTNRIHLCTRPSTLPCPKYVDTYKDYTHMYCNC